MLGIAAWLGYFAAIVLVGAKIAVSFGDYAKTLFIRADASQAWSRLFGSLIALAMAGLIVVGVRCLDRPSRFPSS